MDKRTEVFVEAYGEIHRATEGCVDTADILEAAVRLVESREPPGMPYAVRLLCDAVAEFVELPNDEHRRTRVRMELATVQATFMEKQE